VGAREDAPLAVGGLPLINRQPCLQGYFESVDNRPIAEIERLKTHCFAWQDGTYEDEDANPLAGPISLVGVGAVPGIGMLSNWITRCLPFASNPGVYRLVDGHAYWSGKSER